MSEGFYIVTGSASGLGEEVYKSFNKRNIQALGIDLKESDYTDIVYDLSKLTDKNKNEFLSKIDSKKILGLIHCAALQLDQEKSNLSESWDDTFNTNTRSVYLLSKWLQSSFVDNSSICIISSVHSVATNANNTIYASSKSAINGLISGLTNDFGSKTACFQIILGAMGTPKLFNNVSEKQIEKMKNILPRKDILRKESVAQLVIDLCINYSNILHGSSITLDNGVLSKLATD